MRIALLCLAACGRMGFAVESAHSNADAATDQAAADALVTPADMIYVPAMTYDFAPGEPWKQATVTRGVFIDRDEVTVGRFSQWVSAGRPVPCDGCALDDHYPMSWRAAWNANVQSTDFTMPCSSPWASNGSTFPTSDAGLPMNCITWTQAIAFCAWDGGKRLPTNVEWNLEARGGDHREYVWGNTAPDCAHATYNACAFPVQAGTAHAGVSAHGANDMNGSLWEWTWDATNSEALGPSAVEVPDNSVDWSGVGFSGGDNDMHVIAGGEWGEDATNLALVGGNQHAPGIAWPGQSAITTTGVRCARSSE